jgi:NADH dehydrogenase [ubiquinone] 1 alpha subcomplex assembly factor 7
LKRYKRDRISKYFARDFLNKRTWGASCAALVRDGLYFGSYPDQPQQTSFSMTPLDRIVRERIALDGPMRISDFMQICLLHSEHGYYVKKPAFGIQGDFITAPEISQMFGELLGLCLAQTWMDQGAPEDFCLLELGPGRGTLMSDILRATRSVPRLHSAAEITLLEASKTMQQRQQETLSDYQVNWVSSLDELAEKPIFVIANEFFDALPIRQYMRVGNVWHERLIGLQDDELGFGLSPIAQTGNYLQTRLEDTQDGDIVEVSVATQGVIDQLSKHIQTHGGCALIIDYGDWMSKGDTLQAVVDHKFANVLQSLGDADLTAHVDFEQISVASNCAVSKMSTQQDLLERLGISHRTQTLVNNAANEAQKNDVISAYHRLTHEEEMGTLFKAISLFPQNGPCPAGFKA